MTNYQVRILCYAIVIAAGAITRGIAATATTIYSNEAGGTGSFLMTFGILFFLTETVMLSFNKKP